MTEVLKRVKRLAMGKARNLEDAKTFHHLSLIAFFAWVGLGADGLSSSCYGPEEAFLVLRSHPYLSLFVALGSVITIFVISASYSQIIELFPTGGGGYLVASKLLSPSIGMISGSALLIDYVLTITISIASGADAVFSFLPHTWLPYKLEFAIFGVLVLTVLNLRGVKESVIPLVPVFLVFVATHLFVILYTVIAHASDIAPVIAATRADIARTQVELGLGGMLLLILRAYTMGAGTYTGIEAVSNGLPILREPHVKTGKRTMRYMAFSLAITVFGLMIAYLLFRLEPVHGKTLNAVLFETLSNGWNPKISSSFVLVTLLSEAMLLFIAAQAGFLDGPRVLSNMALDRWLPTRFATLSDRLVSQNGILIMGIAALLILIFSRGKVSLLVILYSINVFITFTLSQLGMVRHWWKARDYVPDWTKKLTINGFGLALTSFILISVTILKFHQGGWITLILTGSLMGVVTLIKRHYKHTAQLLSRLDNLVESAKISIQELNEANGTQAGPQALDPNGRTAVLLVNGFNGLGLHTLFSVLRLFTNVYQNFVFVEVGILDAGNLKGAEEVERLKGIVSRDTHQYLDFMHKNGYHAESYTAIGTDVVEEVAKLAPKIVEHFPNATFFGGQLVFPEETFFTRLLHNFIVFAIQRRFYHQGLPFIILPIRV